MKRLYVVGAGGFGREVAAWAKERPEYGRDWSIAGFLDARNDALAGYRGYAPVVSDPDAFIPERDDLVVLAIGDPATRIGLGRKLELRGAEFLTLIHPQSRIGPNSTLGIGCVLGPCAAVSCDAHLGKFVMMNVGAAVGHDATVGDGVSLQPYSVVLGFASVCEGAHIASHACILRGARVGEYATVGAGTVVLKSVAPHSTVFGMPAKTVCAQR